MDDDISCHCPARVSLERGKKKKLLFPLSAPSPSPNSMPHFLISRDLVHCDLPIYSLQVCRFFRFTLSSSFFEILFLIAIMPSPYRGRHSNVIAVLANVGLALALPVVVEILTHVVINLPRHAGIGVPSPVTTGVLPLVIGMFLLILLPIILWARRWWMISSPVFNRPLRLSSLRFRPYWPTAGKNCVHMFFVFIPICWLNHVHWQSLLWYVIHYQRTEDQ